MRIPPTSRISGLRRGSMLLEACGALALFGMILGLSVQILGWTGSERRRAEQRFRIRQQAANLLERVGALPAEDVTPERLAALDPVDRMKKTLPEGGIDWSVAADPDVPGPRRVTMTVRYRAIGGNPAAPMRLTTWAFPKSAGGGDTR